VLVGRQGSRQRIGAQACREATGTHPRAERAAVAEKAGPGRRGGGAWAERPLHPRVRVSAGVAASRRRLSGQGADRQEKKRKACALFCFDKGVHITTGR